MMNDNDNDDNNDDINDENDDNSVRVRDGEGEEGDNVNIFM